MEVVRLKIASLPHVLVAAGFETSVSKAKRTIQGGGVYIYDDVEKVFVRIQSDDGNIGIPVQGDEYIFRVGKKNFKRVIFAQGDK